MASSEIALLCFKEKRLKKKKEKKHAISFPKMQSLYQKNLIFLCTPPSQHLPQWAVMLYQPEIEELEGNSVNAPEDKE